MLDVAKLMAANVDPLQTVLFGTVVTFAEGFTIIVKENGAPLQVIEFVYCGVTVIVAVIGVVPLFTAVNEGVLFTPFPANPIEGAMFTQLKVVVPPVFALVKVIAETVSPLQTIISETEFT
jgi:hypothetical protein